MKEFKLALVLSVVAIVGVLAIVLLWILGSLKLAVLSLDTFVGVIVALLGIIVTIVLGWQIVNALELRGKMTDLEQRQSSTLDIIRDLSDNVQNVVKLASNLQSGQNSNTADLYFIKGQLVEAFVFYHSALCQAIKAGQTDLNHRIALLQMVCFQIVAPPMVDFNLLKKQIEFDYQTIKVTDAYREPFAFVYEQTMKLFWDKMSSLGMQ